MEPVEDLVEISDIDLVEYSRGATRFIAFMAAWSSYRKGADVFDAITPEVGSEPFELIKDGAAEFTFHKD